MSYNSTSGYYYATIPAMPAGTVVAYKIYAEDGYNNWAVSSENSYTVKKADTAPPVLKEITQSPLYPDDTQSVNVTVALVDETGITQVILSYYNGTDWTNITMTYKNGYYVATIPALPVGTEVVYKIYAVDSYDNWLVSSEFTYVIQKADTTPPVLEDIIQDPLYPTDSQSVNVSAAINDETEITQVILSYYNGTNWTNVTMSYNGETYVAEIPAMPAGTEVVYKIYAVDSYDNWLVSASYRYIVRKSDTTPPVIHEIVISPESPVENQAVTVLANITDEHSVSRVILMYYYGGSWNNVSMNYNSTSGYYVAEIPAMPAGTEVVYKIYAEDEYGNGVFSPAFRYVVTSKLPTVGVTPITYISLGVATVAIVALVIVLFRKR